jgi:2'-5' RNA ligase
MDARYTLKTAHITIIRFIYPLNKNKTFIKLLNQYKDYDFGVVEFESVDFVYNDW